MKQDPKEIKAMFEMNSANDTKSFFLKTFDISLDIEKIEKASSNNDYEFTAVASAEIADNAGDIVLIDGIDMKRYEDSIFPLLSNHDPNRIAGTITKVFKSNVVHQGEKVKALKITAKLNDTEHGKYWKQVKDSGLPLRLSIGGLVKEAELRKNKKGEALGILYTKSELLEVSLTPVPANPAAQENKSINNSDIEKEDDMNKEQYDNLVKKLEDIEKSLEVHETRLDEIASNIVKEVDSKKTIQPIEPSKANESNPAAEEISKQISELVKQLGNIKKI